MLNNILVSLSPHPKHHQQNSQHCQFAPLSGGQRGSQQKLKSHLSTPTLLSSVLRGGGVGRRLTFSIDEEDDHQAKEENEVTKIDRKFEMNQQRFETSLYDLLDYLSSKGVIDDCHLEAIKATVDADPITTESFLEDGGYGCLHHSRSCINAVKALHEYHDLKKHPDYPNFRTKSRNGVAKENSFRVRRGLSKENRQSSTDVNENIKILAAETTTIAPTATTNTTTPACQKENMGNLPKTTTTGSKISNFHKENQMNQIWTSFIKQSHNVSKIETTTTTTIRQPKRPTSPSPPSSLLIILKTMSTWETLGRYLAVLQNRLRHHSQKYIMTMYSTGSRTATAARRRHVRQERRRGGKPIPGYISQTTVNLLSEAIVTCQTQWIILHKQYKQIEEKQQPCQTSEARDHVNNSEEPFCLHYNNRLSEFDDDDDTDEDGSHSGHDEGTASTALSSNSSCSKSIDGDETDDCSESSVSHSTEENAPQTECNNE